MNVFSWTPEAQCRLEEFARAGLTGAQIAEALGVTRNAVLGRCFRTGITLPMTPDKEVSCRGKRGRGRPKGVSHVLRPDHPSRRSRPKGSRAFDDAQIAAAIAARLAGASLPKAAALVGASPGGLKLWLAKPDLMEKGQRVFSLAKLDAASRRAEAYRKEEARKAAIRAWNEGIYRLFPGRNTEILRAWVEGDRGPDLGERYGISRQRVDQIVTKARRLGLKEFAPRYGRGAA